MVSLIDVLILAMAVAGIASIVIMLRQSGALLLGSRIRIEKGEAVEAEIAGERRNAIVLFATEPLERGIDGERLAKALSALGTPFTLSFTVAPLGRARIISSLERDIAKLETVYNVVKLPSLKARLDFARRLYALVASVREPVLYGVAVTLWVKGQGSDVARAAKGILELETGMLWEVEERPELSDMLGLLYPARAPPKVAPPPWAPSSDGILIGRTPEGRPITLEWPRDFERHVGVVGPTGQGKTVLLTGIAVQASLRIGTKIVVFDPKGDLINMLKSYGIIIEARKSFWLAERGQPLPLEDITLIDARGLDEDRLETILSSIVEKLLARPGIKLLVVDEAWRTPKAVEKAVRLGRSLGLYTVYATQSVRDLGDTVLSNTGVFLVFGGPWKGYLEEASKLGLNGISLETMPPGHAVLVRGYSAGRPTKVIVEPFHSLVEIDVAKEPLLKARGESNEITLGGGRIDGAPGN